MLKMEIEPLENYCKPIYERAPSVIHNWGHAKRTAVGAKWFVKLLGGTKEEEELAYIAGILHDIVRPNTEKVDHAQASADEARKILKKFEFEEEKIQLIVQSVRGHRKKPAKWLSPLHQSVFLSDKLLEQMGAYVVFRRATYAGEVKEYADMEAKEAIPIRWNNALKKTEKQFFVEKFHELYDYQNAWQMEFIEAFEKNEKWANRLGSYSFGQGRKKNSSLDQAIYDFEPNSEKEEKFRSEALDYMQGKKFAEFKKMVLQGD